MKLLKSGADIINDYNPYKKIEKIGRLCYKSEDKITEDSCYGFVQRLIDHKHFAMLEHGWVGFFIDMWPDDALQYASMPFCSIVTTTVSAPKCTYNVWVSLSHLYNPRYQGVPYIDILRSMVEEYYLPEGTSMKCPYDSKLDSTDIAESNIVMITEVNPYISIKFLCDRGVSHELVRHRCSVAQESTRYCNYSLDKFGGSVNFIEPADYDNWPEDKKSTFVASCDASEKAYLDLISKGSTPQQARAVLINALKTEVVLTMNCEQWHHFFDVRSRGLTGAPHPDMKIVADMALDKVHALGFTNI